MKKLYKRFYRNNIVRINKNLQLIKKDIDYIKKRNIKDFGEIKQNTISVTCPKCQLIVTLHKPFKELKCDFCDFSHNFSKNLDFVR